MRRAHNFRDITGQSFGKLTVLCLGYSKNYKIHWECKCECGNTSYPTTGNLLNGKSRSCGCERTKALIERNYKHGLAHQHSLYHVWASMKSRCENPKEISYKNYGARGICVCNEWKRNFKKFYSWAIQNGYVEGLEIDRIDNNGNYESNNCRFVTKKENQRNKRNNHLIEIDGKIKTMSQWAEESKISLHTLSSRIKYGYTGTDLIKPVKKIKPSR